MKEKSSFRDPCGFIFFHNDKLLRAINYCYKREYDYLIESGLYDELVSLKLLIKHKNFENEINLNNCYYKIIEPQRIPFVSYPYEWSFSQLKDAALLTLRIQKIALKYGMSLKDASAYNIQFYEGHPVFIDTISFEFYSKGLPWKAYKQFCQHFLAPLALMGKKDIRLNCIFKNYIDGIPLDLCCKLLPTSSIFKFGLFLNIYLHTYAQRKFNNDEIKTSEIRKNFSKNSMLTLISSLERTLNNIKWKANITEWNNYYELNVHEPEYISQKKQIVSKYINQANPKTVWDFGSNTGVFSRLASEKNIFTISFDFDPACVEDNYRLVKEKKEKNILPLLFDLNNPSPTIGWANSERKDIYQRGPVDLILALAIIHHLAITNNLPLSMIAEYFSKLAIWIIIEFVPKNDDKVKILLNTREDIFINYNQTEFEKEFCEYFDIILKDNITVNNRIIYLFRKKGN